MEKIKVIRKFYKNDLLSNTIVFYKYGRTRNTAISNVLQFTTYFSYFANEYSKVETIIVIEGKDISYDICTVLSTNKNHLIQWLN